MHNDLTKDNIREIISESVAELIYISDSNSANNLEHLTNIETNIAILQEKIDLALAKIEDLERNIENNNENTVIKTLLN
jgi:hypothetical protein